MRRFLGYRPHPPAECLEKGTALPPDQVQYEGCVFTDGTLVLRWLTEYCSHSVWRCWDDFWHVHGHPEYGTRIVWLDETEQAHGIRDAEKPPGWKPNVAIWLTCACGWRASVLNDQVEACISMHAVDPESNAAELAMDLQDGVPPGSSRRRYRRHGRVPRRLFQDIALRDSLTPIEVAGAITINDPLPSGEVIRTTTNKATMTESDEEPDHG